MTRLLKVSVASVLFLLATGDIEAQNDRKGSSDHPLITRMPDFWIAVYQESEYESHSFRDSSDMQTVVEGRYFHIEYRLKQGAQSPGRLMILKNYENALKTLGSEPWIRKEKVLVNEYGIAAERLTGKGAGPLCPVGSNKDEGGRKLNRRVELVES